jgi:hypothetical protein
MHICTEMAKAAACLGAGSLRLFLHGGASSGTPPIKLKNRKIFKQFCKIRQRLEAPA